MTEFKEINDTHITDFTALRKLGDRKMKNLIHQVGKTKYRDRIN